MSAVRGSVELAEVARRIVYGSSLADKLAPAPASRTTDRDPGPVERAVAPGRPADLAIVARAPHVPRAAGMADPAQRARILHAVANHELQAVELFAWALLAFPGAPAEFRRGVARILGEEQSHVRAYAARLDELGMAFGELPVSAYFWGKIGAVATPAQFVCAMGLTFENANLDHTLAYAAAARRAGDPRTAKVFEQVHADEVTHVGFAAAWLKKLAPGAASLWDAYVANLQGALLPGQGRTPAGAGDAGRHAAGLDPDFVQHLVRSPRRRSEP